MGVRLAWQLAKIAELSLPSHIKEGLINDLRRKNRNSLKVYALQVHNGVAPQVFLSIKQLLRYWVKEIGSALFVNKETIPSTLTVLYWTIPTQSITQYITNKEIVNVPVPEDTLYTTVNIPPDLFSEFNS